MRRKTISLIALLLTCGLCVCVLIAGEQPNMKDFSLALSQAKTLDEFEKATIEAQERRLEFINSLIRMLRSKTDEEKTIRICYILGEYRATEAIFDLAKLITLEYKANVNDKKYPRWSRYPVQEALIKCGSRSIPYMLRNIESSDNKQVQELSAGVIWQVIGEGLKHVLDGKVYARMIIEKRMNEETDFVKKARLKSSLGFLK